MGDSARRLASKVVAGVGLLVAGCNELRNSGGAIARRRGDRLEANRTDLENESRQETPRVKPTGTTTRRSGRATGSPPTETPDPTPPNRASPTPGRATPTRVDPTATETAGTPGGGSASGSGEDSTSWPPDTSASAGVSGGGTTGGSSGGSVDQTSTPSGGTGDGSGDGSGGGTGDGTSDGSNDGTSDGSNDGTSDGTNDGTNDGTSDGSGDGTSDGSGDGTSDGSDDETGDGTSDGSDDETGDGISSGPAIVVEGVSGIAPVSAEQTISLGDSEVGYLCDVDLNRPFVTRYSFAAADGRPLNCYLLPHDELDPMRAGEPYRSCLTFSNLASFDMGPFTLSTGRYALVVEQATESSTDPVDVTVEFELHREA